MHISLLFLTMSTYVNDGILVAKNMPHAVINGKTFDQFSCIGPKDFDEVVEIRSKTKLFAC